MRAHNKEVVYVIRDSEGMITDVFDPKTNQYLKVIDTAIKIDSSKPEKVVNKWKLLKSTNVAITAHSEVKESDSLKTASVRCKNR